MAFDPLFLNLMNASVSYRAVSSRDNYGKSTEAAAIPLRCKISQVTDILRTADLEDITVHWTIHLPPPGYVLPDASTTTYPTITTLDFISLDGTSYLPVRSVDMPYDETGQPHHQKVRV